MLSRPAQNAACTLGRAQACVHTHTHTRTWVSGLCPIQWAVALLTCLPLSEASTTTWPGFWVPWGVCSAVALACVGGWHTQLALSSALLALEQAGLLKAHQIWLFSPATFYSFNFSFFLRKRAFFQFPRGNSLLEYGAGVWHRTYCWWWRWFLPPAGWDLYPGPPARLPRSGQQGPKWLSFHLRLCRLRRWSGWLTDLPEIPRSQWASRPCSRHWADRSRKGPILVYIIKLEMRCLQPKYFVLRENQVLHCFLPEPLYLKTFRI